MPPTKKSQKDSDESKKEPDKEPNKESDKEPDTESDTESEQTVQTAPPSPPVGETVIPGSDLPKRRPVQLAAPSRAGVISYTAPQSKPG